MIRGNLNFQTFYTSKEESNCPLITEIVRIGKKIEKKNISKDVESLIVSLRYGRRMIINGNYKEIGGIRRGEILEIVDYDPVKKILLTIGPIQPRSETPIHWMIHHARNEVNAVIQINGEKIIEKMSGKIQSTEKEQIPGSFESIKEVLKVLRDSKSVLTKNQGVLFVGENIKEVEEQVFKNIKV
jgi:ribulose-5-phosphate 4-epimerase/fuculose-1-phosphate aldolase